MANDEEPPSGRPRSPRPDGGRPADRTLSLGDTPAAAPPGPIGPYHIREKLGEGGFGEVFVAEQTTPVRRLVALKVLKAGMDTRAVLARFAAERQALALMDHPSVCKVLDAGETEQGRPYFVMELVRGEPITAYCDHYRLSNRQRLELFIHVCHAVQHAHQKGIIHRDLKPSNILVTVVDDQPLPKVIDFGIAKATSASLSVGTVYTQQGQLLGTPEYMSPEQASTGGHDVDTRTDVYSLGVVLYQLLCGRLPFEPGELRRSGAAEISHMILDGEPPRPSSRISTPGDDTTAIARLRCAEQRALVKELRDNLDWIVLRAIEKDRTRRYETANMLATDIQRYLRHEPVVAGPPSTAYITRMFLRRHRFGVAAGALVVGAIAVALAGMGAGLVRAKRAEEEARLEAATSEQVLEFLVGIFEVSSPGAAQGNTVTAREILDRGAERIEEQLGGQPIVQARLMRTMGRVYRELGLYHEARPFLERALAIQEATFGADDPRVARSLNSLGNLLWETSDYVEARKLLERALAIREKALGPNHPDVATVLNNLAGLLRETGDFDESRALYERALAVRERALGPDDPAVAHSLTGLAAALSQDNDFAGARLLYERALAIRERALGPDHPDVAQSLNNLGQLLYQIEDYAGARPLLERALAIEEKSSGPEHPDVAYGLNNLAELLRETGDLEGALPLHERALAIREKALGDDHPDVATSLHNLACLHRDLGHYEQAARLFERGIQIDREKLGETHPFVAEDLTEYAKLLRLTGDDGEAGRLEARAERIRADQPGAAPPG